MGWRQGHGAGGHGARGVGHSGRCWCSHPARLPVAEKRSHVKHERAAHAVNSEVNAVARVRQHEQALDCIGRAEHVDALEPVSRPRCAKVIICSILLRGRRHERGVRLVVWRRKVREAPSCSQSTSVHTTSKDRTDSGLYTHYVPAPESALFRVKPPRRAARKGAPPRRQPGASTERDPSADSVSSTQGAPT